MEYYLLDDAFLKEIGVPYVNLTELLVSRKSQELSVWEYRQCFAYLKHNAAMRIIASVDYFEMYYRHIAFYKENGFVDEGIFDESDIDDFISIDHLYCYRDDERFKIVKNLKTISEINFLEEFLTYGFLDLYKDWIQESSFSETGHSFPFSFNHEAKPFASLKTINYLLKHDFGKDVGIDFRKLRYEKAQAEKAKLDANFKFLDSIMPLVFEANNENAMFHIYLEFMKYGAIIVDQERLIKLNNKGEFGKMDLIFRARIKEGIDLLSSDVKSWMIKKASGRGQLLPSTNRETFHKSVTRSQLLDALRSSL